MRILLWKRSFRDHDEPVIEIIDIAKPETSVRSVISEVALFYMELSLWAIEGELMCKPASGGLHVVRADHGWKAGATRD